jgi:hypothetical protein
MRVPQSDANFGIGTLVWNIAAWRELNLLANCHLPLACEPQAERLRPIME